MRLKKSDFCSKEGWFWKDWTEGKRVDRFKLAGEGKGKGNQLDEVKVSPTTIGYREIREWGRESLDNR